MVRLKADAAAVAASPYRWRLSRGGLLNVWQYDDQVFDFADGRLLLRGTNGAGKSKTLEMLLPFVLDADRARMDASGKRGATLVWLMLDGVDGTLRTGYLWMELARDTEEGGREHLTLGIGLRASRSARTVSLWCFTLPGRIGEQLVLEDEAGPLGSAACREAVTAAGGDFYDSPKAYKAAVGRQLFGLDEAGYDDLLRLLYWLRSPQIGESVEIAELDRTLALALPELDRAVVDAAAENFNALAEFGEQVERREKASLEVQRALAVYHRYAAGEVSRRVAALLEARAAAGSAERAALRAAKALDLARSAEAAALQASSAAEAAVAAAQERRRQLESSQAARDLEALELLRTQADAAQGFAKNLAEQAIAAEQRSTAAVAALVSTREEMSRRLEDLRAAIDRTELGRLGLLPLEEPALDDLPAHREALGVTGQALRTAVVAVEVCLQALATVELAQGQQETAEQLAGAAADRAESATASAADAHEALMGAESGLAQAAANWLGAAPFAVTDEVPDASELRDWRDLLVAPRLAELATKAGGLAREITDVEAQLSTLAAERVAVEAENDPAPPPPALARGPRDAGLPLWRLVDVRAGVSAQDRAGLEAALQSSGLLDALVLADGTVLDGDDVVLAAGPAVTGSASELLVAAVPDGSPVAAAVVERLLAGLSVQPSEQFVAVDGSWRLGALSGRARKEQAQYLGASARAAERLRRLAALADRSAAVELVRLGLVEAQELVRADRARLVAWAAALPDPTPVLADRTRYAERLLARDATVAAAGEAERRAAGARERTAGARRELTKLAGQAGVPEDRAGLSSRQERLRDLVRAVTTALAALTELERTQVRGLSQEQALEALTAAAVEAAVSSGDARAEAERAHAAYDARREALSATQQELARALEEAAEDDVTARRSQAAAVDARVEAGKALAHAEDGLRTSEAGQRDSEQRRRRTHEAGAALHRAPGLVQAALGEAVVDAEDWEGLRAAVGGVPTADSNALLTAHRDLAAGAAAHLQVRLETGADDLYVVSGRDDEGQAPLAALAARLATRVEHDRTLLTAQQRAVCEKHLLGELGEVLRKRRLEAGRLVAHMNALLDGVKTSQGIRARLDWRLRDDAGDQVRGTVTLLERPLGSLLPAQREQLLELLSSLIEQARQEDPDGGYAEHLRLALDYRTWNSFSVLVRRPGVEQEERLSRRTALSQGEQKVVCYLPLFAAAAAHFTSLAVEAPLAPRFVLLDDAFPKIDVRTHPVLFGLLVDLELDWVVTSERLWGDYPTVPAVAVYEVLRSANERGVLPYKHLWDGRALRAVGA